jgi:heme-degrading monooxygenase HmoA
METTQPLVVVVSLFKYAGFLNKFWAFTMMQFAHGYLKDVEGLRFYRVLGTGAGKGFSWYSDFSTYALLTVWETEAQADRFLEESELYAQYRARSQEMVSVYMTPLRSHGQWSGQNPFKPDGQAEGDITAVITRATIANRQLLRFWRQVPRTSASLERFSGLICAKGIGEWPIKQMATFSIWKDEESMKAYAYHNSDHLKAIKKTRQLNWYTEELFARFRPFKSSGTWHGSPLLPF